MKGMVNMKKLASLILMASVKMWKKQNEETEQKAYSQAIKNYKKVLKSMNKNDNGEYNYNKYRYMKQTIKRMKKLKKLNKNSNISARTSYNVNIRVGKVKHTQTSRSQIRATRYAN